MPRQRLFRLANRLRDKVEYIGLGRQSLYFDVIDQHVEMRTEQKGTRMWCSCKSASINPDSLCIHALACILYYAKYLEEKDKNVKL